MGAPSKAWQRMQKGSSIVGTLHPTSPPSNSSSAKSCTSNARQTRPCHLWLGAEATHVSRRLARHRAPRTSALPASTWPIVLVVMLRRVLARSVERLAHSTVYRRVASSAFERLPPCSLYRPHRRAYSAF